MVFREKNYLNFKLKLKKLKCFKLCTIYSYLAYFSVMILMTKILINKTFHNFNKCKYT